MNKLVLAVPLMLLTFSCASTSMSASKTLTLAGTGTNPTHVEVTVTPTSVGFTRVRAQVIFKAEDLLTSARFTFFEDVNGNGAFDAGDRKLGSCFGETSTPSKFIEVSGVQLGEEALRQKTMVFAEIETVHGRETAVLPLEAARGSL